MLIYKVVSGILLGLLLVCGVFLYIEKSSHSKTKTELTNKIAQLEGLVKETKDSWSIRGVEVDNLKTDNKKLQNIIKSREEEIVSLSEIALKWKTKYFEIKDAKETVVGSDGSTTVVIPPNCQDCLKDLRFKVDFDQVKDFLKVSGHTLTNPPYAELSVEWIRDVKLNLILTKTENNDFRIYLDSKDSDAVPSELVLKVDPSVFEKKWYEKISVGTDVAVGPGVLSSIKVAYDVFDDFSVGPNVNFIYDGKELNTLYGASILWYPLR